MYLIDFEVFRLLKFIEDQQETDSTKKTSGSTEFKRIFNDKTKLYSRVDIELRFKQLLERLTVYIPESDIYKVKASKTICRVFDQ